MINNYEIDIPIRIKVSKRKKHLLNINTYRNLHYHPLNNLKKKFGEIIQDKIQLLPFFNKIELEYIIYLKRERKIDLMNIGSIVDKFFCDELVNNNKIKDDSILYVKKMKFSYRTDSSIKEEYVKINIKEIEKEIENVNTNNS